MKRIDTFKEHIHTAITEGYEQKENSARYFIPTSKLMQYELETYHKEGYKLFYVDLDKFELIEITKIGKGGMKWQKEWGNALFLLNAYEQNRAVLIVEKCKELYDKYIEQIDNIKRFATSSIYYNVLKKEK
jgi:hypothetical protein